MLFTLEALPAKQGDCLLLHYGTKATPKLAVIDGGPSGVYKPTLRKRLEFIRTARGLGDQQSLPLDMVMVSHIDDDHIIGIGEMTRELNDARMSGTAAPYKIKLLWHNSFDEIIGNLPDELTAAFTAQFGAASTATSAFTSFAESRKPDLERDAAMVLASVEKGHKLRTDARALGLNVNAPFKDLVIARGNKLSRVPLKGGLDFTVVGPMRDQLLKLQKEYDKKLKQLIKKGQIKPEAAVAALADDSISNLSSIVVLAKADGRSMLLTGDARSDLILKGLERTRVLKPNKKMFVDVLKMPHHGSNNNVDDEFFDRVRAKHYVFSGDGAHGNPERATFEMLFNTVHHEDFEIHLTYPVTQIDEGRKKAAAIAIKKKHRRKKWNHEKESLQAFFAKMRKKKRKFTINEAGQSGRILIELGQKIGV